MTSSTRRAPTGQYNYRVRRIQVGQRREEVRKTLLSRIWWLLLGAKEFFWLFIANSSIHGFRYLQPSKELHYSERLCWWAAVCLAVWGSLSLSGSTLRRFNQNPTVVSMEHNYKDWNTSFPSVTLCPIAPFGEDNLHDYIAKQFPNVPDKEELAEFLRNLANSTYGTFGDLKPVPKGPKPAEYWKAVWKIAFPFYYNVSNSAVEYFTQEKLNTVVTEIGICYSYNSATTIYNDPKYWEKNSWSLMKNIRIFEGSPLDGDIFAQVMNMNAGYRMYLLAPGEFPDIAAGRQEAGNNSYKTLDLTALSMVISDDAAKLRVGQRRCRLPHESELLTSPVYSYNLCRMECRMKAAHRMCGCVPFFYRPTDAFPVCGPDGMKCLDKYAEPLIRMLNPETGKKYPCDCVHLCSEVNYVIDSDNTMDWTLGTNLKWGLIKYPKFRLKRDILFGWTDLLVSIGGTAGLFLGCSILSFAEMFYFFTLRLFWFTVKRKRKLPQNKLQQERLIS